jgi:hypothetical protein
MVLFKQLYVRFVSFNIAPNLRLPVVVIGAGERTITHGTTMPETSINEYGYLLLWKSDVGIPLYVITVKPPSVIPRTSKKGA